MLKVVAISAPHWLGHKGIESQKSLNSTDPFSLQNALRVSAWEAQTDNSSYWNNSNWNTREGLSNSIKLMNYYENEKDAFIDLLLDLKPNLLFIGAMSLSYRGAIEIAKEAKKLFGENIFIVLGGKHSNETLWSKNNETHHYINSPLKNIVNNKTENIFDLIISGDGEYVIFEIGEIMGEMLSSSIPVKYFYNYTTKLINAKGNWVAGWVDSNNEIQTIESIGTPIDYNLLPTPAETFGITANFPIFESDITGHSYSDTSKGCVFDCFFCSERSAINGKPLQRNSAPQRLYNQFKKIVREGKLLSVNTKVSSFVEDSIILTGNINLLNEFNELLSANPLPIKWGCQLTIDSFLDPKMQEVIKKLKSSGLVYIMFGMETINENVAFKMSKNTHKEEKWKSRNELAMEAMSRLGLKTGVCVLWGIGESQSDRVKHLQTLKEWQLEYGAPNVISLNWAVTHPLRQLEIEEKYDYINWGTSENCPQTPYLIELFGEASEIYNLRHMELPKVSELKYLRDLYYNLIFNQVEYSNKLNII
jgi:B12-binding domain/radical SAM domain protein